MQKLALLVAVAACGSSSKPEPDQRPTASAPAPEEPTNVEGKLVGGVEETPAFLRIHYAGRRVPLRDLPIAAYLGGLPMTGTADITVDVTVPVAQGRPDYRKAAGVIDVGCTGCALGDDQARLTFPTRSRRTAAFAGDGIDFGHIAIDSARAQITIRDGRAKLAGWTFASPDLGLDLGATVELARDLADSTIEGCIAFRPEDALLKRAPKTHAALSITGAMVGADRRFHIRLTDKLGDVKRLAQDCTISR